MARRIFLTFYAHAILTSEEIARHCESSKIKLLPTANCKPNRSEYKSKLHDLDILHVAQ